MPHADFNPRLSWSAFLTVILVGILATITLSYHLSYRSFWYDEADSIDYAAYPIQTIHQCPDKGAMPVYFWLLALWIRIVGCSELAVRTLTVIFGVSAVLLLLKLGEKLYDRRTGISAACLLAMAPMFVMFGQNARQHVPAMAPALFLLIEAWDQLFSKEKKSSAIRIYLWSALLIAINYYGLFMTLSLAVLLYAFGGPKKSVGIKLAVASMAIGFFLFIGALFAAESNPSRWSGLLDQRFEINRVDQEPEDLIKAFIYGGDRIGSGGIGHEIAPERLRIPRLAIPLFGALMILGIVAEWKARRNKHLIFLAAMFAAPIAIGIALRFVFHANFQARYFLFCLPIFILLIVRGLEALPKTVFWIALIMLIVINIFGLINLYNPSPSESWREVASWIKLHQKPEEPVVVSPLQEVVALAPYATDDRCPSTPVAWQGFRRDGRYEDHGKLGNWNIIGIPIFDEPAFNMNHPLMTQLDKTNGFFLVVSPYWTKHHDPRANRVLNAFLSRFEQSGSYEARLEGIVVYHLRPPKTVLKIEAEI